jgi:hypothetical protein
MARAESQPLHCGFVLWNRRYAAAANYLHSQRRLTALVVLKTYRSLEPQLELTFADRTCWLRCGNHRFPPATKIRAKLDAILKSGHRAHMAWRILRLHPFPNGNGQFARLLLAWPGKKPLLFKTDDTSTRAWHDAVTAPSWKHLAALVQRTKRETPVLGLVSTEFLDTTTTTPDDRCDFCAAGIVDCCSCPYRNQICHPSIRH